MCSIFTSWVLPAKFRFLFFLMFFFPMSLFDSAITNNSQTLETHEYRRSINSNILNPLQLL